MPGVRITGPADAPEVARLLDRFNTEYDEFTPGVDFLAGRLASLMETGELTALLAESPAIGVAVIRFRPAIWTDTLDAYLEELYVVPESRGHGHGRALLNEVIEYSRERGAADIHLGTSTADIEAMSLYESAGFTKHEGGPDGPTMLFYERSL